MNNEYLLYDQLSKYSFRELRDCKGTIHTEELTKSEIMDRFQELSEYMLKDEPTKIKPKIRFGTRKAEEKKQATVLTNALLKIYRRNKTPMNKFIPYFIDASIKGNL